MLRVHMSLVLRSARGRRSPRGVGADLRARDLTGTWSHRSGTWPQP